MDEVESEFESRASEAQGFYKWQMKAVPEFPSNTSFVQSVTAKRTKLGSLNTGALLPQPVAIGRKIDMTLVPTIRQPSIDQRYRHPILTYTVKLTANYNVRRAGLIEFSIFCGTQSNYLFDLREPGWSFTFKSASSEMRFIGDTITRIVADRVNSGRRIWVTAFQSFVTRLFVPEFTLEIVPNLIAYAEDPPEPPEPTWFAQASCKMISYVMQVSQPVEQQRWERSLDQQDNAELLEESTSEDGFELV